MKELSYLTRMIAAMIDPKLRTATAFIAPDYTMRLSRVSRHQRKNGRSRTFSLTLGKPNFEAQQFVKACVKAGEPFPIKKLKLRMWPVQQRKKRKKKHG